MKYAAVHSSAFALGALASILPLHADDRIWAEPAFGVYNFGASWEGGAAPGIADRGILGASLTTTFNPIACLFLGPTDTGGMLVTSGYYSLNYANAPLGVRLRSNLLVGAIHSEFNPGLSADARLMLEFDGSLTTDGETLIGVNVYGFGARKSDLIVRGAQTSVLSRGDIVVGNGASLSSVKVSAGARLTTDLWMYVGAGSASQLLINDPSSSVQVAGELRIGNGATGGGLMRIEGGGEVGNQLNGVVGLGGASGSAEVFNAGSVWTVGEDCVVGTNRSYGSLVIGYGGSVKVDRWLYLGRDEVGSEGLVYVLQQGLLDVAGEMRVGGAGKGYLRIESGGQASCSENAVLGAYGGRGDATVTDVGSRWTQSADFIIGGGLGLASGGLLIERGAQVLTTRSGYIARTPGAGYTGSVSVRDHGSRWEIGRSLVVGTRADATLHVTLGGRVVVGNTVNNQTEVTIGQNGDLRGTGTVVGNVLNEAGLLSPGEPLGKLTIDGTLEQRAAGRTQVQIAGTTPGAFDRLVVLSSIKLGGTLEISLAEYQPSPTDAWLIVQGDITQPFDQIVGPPGYAVNLQYISGIGAEVSFVRMCAANCDNSTVPPVLNVADFVCFQNRFAAGDTYGNCDQSTTPPVLNVADFICYMNKFAAGCT